VKGLKEEIMKKELLEYIKQVRAWIDLDKNLDKRLEGIKTNIEFFQHERLVHLIVTMTFALLTVVSLGLTVARIYFLPLFILFLVLEVPYIFHYYALENGVQKLQALYREAINKISD